jgi:transcriptional regulator with XRE-family HTH domain
MEYEQTLGMRLRAARKRKKLTGEQLGKVVGVSKAAISQWENDLSLPSVESVVSLCEVLDISADYLLRGSSDDVQPEMLRLLKKIAGLDEAGIALLRRLFGDNHNGGASR